MKEQKLNEETLVDETKRDVKNVGNKVEDQKATVKTSGQKVTWKQVGIGSASAILLGGTAAALMGFANANDITEAPNAADNDSEHEIQLPNVNVTVDGLPVAKNVNDDMSFGEAFSAARSETGAGGVFTWHGGVYGTYLANEWNDMSSEEQAAFGSHVHYSAANIQTAEESQNTGYVTEDLIAEADVEVENNSEDAEATNNENIDTDNTEIEPETEATEEINIQEAVAAEEKGEVVETNNAVDAMVTEADVEDNVDGIISDETLADNIETQAGPEAETMEEADVEIVETITEIQEQQELIANDLQQTMEETTAQDNGVPDYINDADVSGFELV